MFFKSCAPERSIREHNFHGGERNVGPVLGQVVQPRRDRMERGGLLVLQLGGRCCLRCPRPWSVPWPLLLAYGLDWRLRAPKL